MPVVFLNPWAGLLALLLCLPILASARLRDRDRAVRRVLRLPAASRRALLAPVAAALATAAILTLAATQPALVRTSTRTERTDAEALFVLDISRSMLAAASAGAPTRLERAKKIAARVRAALPTVPAGTASITDRVLPYLLPSTDERVFRSTLRDAVAVDEPPPTNIYYDRATALAALAEIPARNFFSPTAKKRLVVVLTDGESRPVAARQAAALQRARLRTVLVHVWKPGERVFATGRPETTYHSDPESAVLLENVADEANGVVVSETDREGATHAARSAVGRGPVRRVRDHRYLALMRPVVLIALVPLAFLLWRRNAWVLGRARRLANERKNRWFVSRESRVAPALSPPGHATPPPSS